MPDKKEDVLLMGPDLGDGTRACLRNNGGVFSAGTLATIKDGQPISSELVRLTQRTGNLYDVEQLYDPSPGSDEKSGPSQVATDDYRTGWEAIWGTKTVGEA